MSSSIQIVVSIRRGRLENVFCTDASAELALVEWDVDGARPESADRVACRTAEGMLLAHVSRPHVESLGALRHAKAGRILDAARRKRRRTAGQSVSGGSP